MSRWSLRIDSDCAPSIATKVRRPFELSELETASSVAMLRSNDERTVGSVNSPRSALLMSDG